MKDLRFYKFAKRKRICELMNEGSLCLNPASKYGESGLSKGAFDPYELSFLQSMPDGATFEAFCGKTGKSKGKLDVVNMSFLEAKSETNYYVFCMAYQYFNYLYEEFNSDTCLVITDPDRFINQACKSIMKDLPGWFVNAGTVTYKSKRAFYSLNPSYDDIFFGKDTDDYAHQYEIRIICVPPNPIEKLPTKIVNIGNLHGYTYITGVEHPEKMIESEYANAIGSPFKCK